MSTATSTAEILLRINSDLAALSRARSEFASLKGEVTSFGAVFKGAFAADLVMSGISGMVNAARAGFSEITGFIKQSMQQGVQFNSTLETSKLGIAAVMKQFNPDKYQQFGDAIKDAGVAIDLLKKKALESPATFESLLQALQGTTGAMTSAGIGMEQQVTLITNMSQALSGLGIRSEQILQETRAIIRGDVNNPDAAAAKILDMKKEEWNAAKQKGQLYEYITGKISAFAEAGRLGAQSISVLESNLEDARTQVAAGATEELTEAYRRLLVVLTEATNSDGFKNFLRALSDGAAMLVTKFAELLSIFNKSSGLNSAIQKFSDYFKALWQSGKDGNLGEIVKLSLELAFKEVINILARGVKATALTFWDLLTSGAYWGMMFKQWKFNTLLIVQVFSDGILTAMRAALALVMKMQNPFSSYQGNFKGMEGMQDYIMDPLRKIVSEAGSELINANIEGSKLAAETFIKRFSESADLIDTAKTSAQLSALVKAGAAKYDAGRKVESKGAEQDSIFLAPFNVNGTPEERRKALEASLRAYRAQLEAIRNELARIDGDWTKTSAQKWEEKQRILAQEKAKLDEIIAALEKKLELEKGLNKDSPNVAALTSSIEDFTKQRESVATKQAGAGPNPNDISDNMRAEMVKLQDSWGTVAQQMAKSFADVFSGAINSISNGITGLIMRTKSWGQALSEIGISILTSIVSAIVQMGVRWVATQIMMAAAGKTIMAASVAASMPLAAAQTAIWSPPATLATIATLGAAAAQAPIAVGAAQIATLGLSLAQFAEGGYTGPGGKWEPAGIVHRGEIVFSQADIARLGGVSAVEDIRSGAPAYASTPGASLKDEPKQQQFIFVDSRREAERIRAGSEAETQIIDIVRRNQF